jgi:hypothetical protein
MFFGLQLLLWAIAIYLVVFEVGDYFERRTVAVDAFARTLGRVTGILGLALLVAVALKWVMLAAIS